MRTGIIAVLAVFAASSLQPAAVSLDRVPDVEPMTKRWTIDLNTRGLADQVASSGRLDIQLPDSSRLSFLLTETEIFAPGEKKVVGYGPDGRILYEKPLQARVFTGSVEGGAGVASITIAPEGLYGGLEETWGHASFQPLSWTPDGEVRQEVAITEFLVPAVPPQPSARLASNEYLNLKPYSEPAYRSYASDYANRITGSLAYAASTTMWSSEANIHLFVYSIGDLSMDFPSQNTCGGYDMGLGYFRTWWVDRNMIGGVNAYLLYHAYDSQASLAGCAYKSCDGPISGCLSSFIHPYPQTSLASATVLAKDHCACDSYDPDDTRHLALALHQEVGHLAGEPDHPSDGNCITGYNVMVSGATFWCTQFWFTTTSEDRIKSYSAPRL